MKRPNDLVAFLQQNEYLQLIVILNAKLLVIKTELVKKMEQSKSSIIDFMYQNECIINYLLKDSDLFSTLITKKYLNRITNSQKKMTKNSKDWVEVQSQNYQQPICEDVQFSMSCLEHLDSMVHRNDLEMMAELMLNLKDLGIASPMFVEMLVNGMQREPLSWQYSTLSSYYWRSQGMAGRAIACARRAIWLAPRKYKDIPLLSLGTILQRANRSQDAVVALNAAADHAPNVAENLIALGNGLFSISEFNKSLDCYVLAKTLDNIYEEKERQMRKSITCFKIVKTKLRQIEINLAAMRSDLAIFTKGRDYLNQYYEKLLREQVPIGSRLLDPSFDIHSHHFLQRGQYCTIRKTSDSVEPVLFCDFYSDLQMQLHKDSTIDTIQNYIDIKTEFIRDQSNLSLGIYKNLNTDHLFDSFELNQQQQTDVPTDYGLSEIINSAGSSNKKINLV